MANFVLVHGAWYGSWCWKRVRKALQAAGNDVFTPTLTGVGERSHLLSREVNLETHIQDVLNLIKWEELTDIVLCGHVHQSPFIDGGDWIDRVGTTLVFNAGRQPGPIPTRIELDTDDGWARWSSYEGVQEHALAGA